MAKERTGTAFALTKLPKAVVTPPLDQQHCSGENQGLANEDEKDTGKAEQITMPHLDEDMEEAGGLTPAPTNEQTTAVSTPAVEKRATTGEVQQRGCSTNITKQLKRTVRHKRAARAYVSQYTNPEGRHAISEHEYNRCMELPELKPRRICVNYLQGLIHIVPPFRAGDDAGKYCIGNFTIDLYAGLLQDRQEKYLSGHDCVVYVTALMDVLSLKTVGLHFEHGYVRRMREKCLLSILLYKIAHFPKALLGLH
ncbi:hypothetical protein Cgig2_020313 [Carnegiea gigantea]|uniref:Uncharacterized protein n=1 Tax=Carnegiea gigantea TaxID=171969 RepID=A0A9Q1Q6S7_9CARY|nr:hypothetical protein Cgig2_020313 [Carnegiea gigantea]